MPRRTAGRRHGRHFWAPSHSGEFDDLALAVRIQLALAMSPVRRVTRKRGNVTPKRSPAPKRVAKNSRAKKAPPVTVISVIDSDDECNTLVQSKSDEIQATVKGKVDSFFKSSGLISDDEDESVLLVSNNSLSKSNVIDLDEPCCSTSNSSNESKVIVVDDDTNQINSLADIQNYCKETEDLLRNANALLEKFTSTNEKESEPVETVSSTQEKRLGECPICYENLSEKQVMSTKCGHLFCKDCIKKIAVTNKKCPTCRKAVNKKNIIPIYI